MASRSVLPDDYVCVLIEIPDDISISIFPGSELPADWWVYPHPESSRDFGTKWAKSLVSAVMVVPSSIIRKEDNYILNTAHADFARIAFSDPEPFVFDRRLLGKSG